MNNICISVSANHGEIMMRKIRVAIVPLAICVALLSLTVSRGIAKELNSSTQPDPTPKMPVLRSAAALVVDQDTGEFIIQKKANTVVPIASITKLMTAMVVLDADMDLEESITIESKDLFGLRRRIRALLPAGTEITRREALLLTLMSSDNRCARALGRTYPGGMEAFISAMNEKAQSLELNETRFAEPTGLSSNNVSSARDLVQLVDAAYRYDLIREFTTCKKTVIDAGQHVREFYNTNRLVQNPGWNIGLSKTGFISASGRCLVMQAEV
ncbi:MAG TPA: peptidase S11, partial [Deltaproteobacteria bacterium]|nr:peptidase S11 [Deltaproteobacteria bacterium]